ncbi:MAG: hypothetical protein IT435_16090 [Phycisphaerales bacterium]|nr:hypothetical protein [Phycisphaerales bacterium]
MAKGYVPVYATTERLLLDSGGFAAVRQFRPGAYAKVARLTSFVVGDEGTSVEMQLLTARWAVQSLEGHTDYQTGKPVEFVGEVHPVLGDIASAAIGDSFTMNDLARIYVETMKGLSLEKAAEKNSGGPPAGSTGSAA